LATAWSIKDGRAAIVGWGSEVACREGEQPTKAQLHECLTRVADLVDGHGFGCPVVSRFVDAGDRQDDVLSWVISRRGWQACKGFSARNGFARKADDPVDMPGAFFRQWVDFHGYKVPLVEVDVNALRRLAQSALLKPSQDSGATVVPCGLTASDSLVRHLCGTAEIEPGVWSSKPAHRPKHGEWQTRVDLLDCLVYGRAAHLYYDRQEILKKRRKKAGKIGTIGA
jgi:hypothetical protein